MVRSLLAELRAELRRRTAERPTGADDAALAMAIAVVERSQRDGLAAVALDAKVVARLVSDRWSHAAALGEDVLAFAHAARRASLSEQ